MFKESLFLYTTETTGQQTMLQFHKAVYSNKWKTLTWEPVSHLWFNSVPLLEFLLHSGGRDRHMAKVVPDSESQDWARNHNVKNNQFPAFSCAFIMISYYKTLS